MQNEALRINREVVVDRRERFKARVEAIKSGERIFALHLPAEEYIEITPNDIVRYRWMIELCDFTIHLLDAFAETELDIGSHFVDLRGKEH